MLKIVRAYPCYPKFLENFYYENNQIKSLDYENHHNLLIDFGFDETLDFLRSMTSLGYEADSIILNSKKLSSRWMRENGSGPLPYLVQHLKKIKPDILLYDGHAISASMLKLIKLEVPSIKLKLATCCGVINDTYIEWLREADIVITCSKGFVDNFKSLNLRTYFLRHAFPDRFIADPLLERDKSCIFSGALATGSGYHDDRIKLIETLLNSGVPLKIFAQISPYWKELLKEFLYLTVRGTKIGPNKKINFKHFNGVPFSVRLKAFHPIYGQEMYDELRSYLIALNIHAGIAGSFTANQRVFEVCGVGTCLLTDMKQDLHEIYELDKEVVAYSNIHDCLEKMQWLLENPKVALDIGRAAYAKTLKDHLISRRMAELDCLIQSALRL
ncbi:glycosyltransferase [Polynucleobacter paneuropaeus]|nr:glycosyltransferase [Polynucleobacter paneuropaeus]